MKRTLSIAALLMAILMMMMCFVACDEDSKSDSSTNEEVSMDGTYKLVEMSKDGTDMSDQISQMEQYGMSIDLVINGDKATLMGQELTISGDKFTDGTDSIPFTFSNGKITLEQSGEKMVFQKK